MPTCSEPFGAGFPGASLEDELRALDALGIGACLVCGGVMADAAGGSVHCGSCGSRLEAPAWPGGQLAII